MPADRNNQVSSSTESTISNDSTISSSYEKQALQQPNSNKNDTPTKKLASKRFVSRPLQRNQACSTCRSRKVRCDAQKPACGACKRSAAAHGEDPAIVICQYDLEDHFHDEEVDSHINYNNVDLSSPPARKPLAKIVALEQKIAEMEALISQLDLSLNSHPDPSHTLDSRPSISSIPAGPSSVPHASTNPMEVVWTNWPSCLPPRRIISHLVKLYFSLQSGAGQLMFIEPAQLLASLHLPPNHPDFPFVGLLQSIMAVAYQQSVSGNPDQFAFNLLRVCNIKRYWPMDSAVHHYHAKCAKRAIDLALLNGTHLFQVTQSLNVYCYFAYGAAQLVQAWVCSGLAIQFATPLGLNQMEKCQEHLDRTKPKPRSLLPGPRTVVEKYQRAVTFWLAFQMDRFLSVSSGRPHSISESDITSLLPAKPGTSQATIDTIVLTSNPLSISHPHFFSSHPYDVDEFQLELKATILLGRVSDWLIRAPDPVGFNLQKYWKMPDGPIPDLRSQHDFMQLDQDMTTFQMSLPPKFHQTIFEGEGRKVSHSKVMILLIINLSMILLHECFITKELYNLSFERCSQAANKIKWVGDLIFGSGYDCRLLHPFTNYCWAVAVRVLMRQLVQNEIKLIELATTTTSVPSNQPFTSLLSDHQPSSTELDKHQLPALLKVEEDKVKQNLIEIESLLIFNRKIQNRQSKSHLDFTYHHPHVGQHQPPVHHSQDEQLQSLQQKSIQHQPSLQQQRIPNNFIHQHPFHEIPTKCNGIFESNEGHGLNHGCSSTNIPSSDGLNHTHQPILDDTLFNLPTSSNTVIDHCPNSLSIPYNPSSLVTTNHPDEVDRNNHHQFDLQSDLIQFLDHQPVYPNLNYHQVHHGPNPHTRHDTLNHDTTIPTFNDPSSSSSPSTTTILEDQLELNQIYFDQLILLFQIRFQAFRLPDSLSTVLIT
ncbi:hypothetical protein KEM48_010990 [Puccinia striiformis f. sp. tritici PST-130]|nr:hypothetical protein Pst134EB_026552 [Puccinia striiformis f. sp. tritici]KAI9615209.1 hypothetical protein H4Q26_011751 [Puccinia striiformis f. sp. tritici PST-130]KAI9629285.1 hypothetical protein KEM48_010990 [Puccinia striiformis f. sp. tritici PST-130]